MSNFDEKMFLQILRLVRESTAEDPSRVSRIISVATEGVKDFAQDQRCTSSKLANLLLEEALDAKPMFSNEQKAAALYQYFGSAPVFAEIALKYGVPKDWKPSKELMEEVFPR